MQKEMGSPALTAVEIKKIGARKRKRSSPSLPTKEEERVGERSLVLLDFPSPQPFPRSFLAGRGSVSAKCTAIELRYHGGLSGQHCHAERQQSTQVINWLLRLVDDSVEPDQT